jgi:hypothetical protein
MELQRPQPTPPRRSVIPIALAGVLLVLVVGALVLGISAVIPQLAAGIAVVAVGVFVVPLLHYVLWGWWLGKRIRADVEAEEQSRLDRERSG